LKAIVHDIYGPPDVLRLRDVAKPSPKDDEILVAVHAASANAGDHWRMRGKPFLIRLMGFGLLRPRYNILGADIAGRVEAVGKNIKQFKPGDDVFGDLSQCGYGAFAEYVCARESALALKPANVSYEEAAAVPTAAITALQGLRDEGRIQQGQRVLINGASGGIGTFAVQIAKALGASVTAVCGTKGVAMVRAIGADIVVDYTQEDFTNTGQRYDLILDTAAHRSLADCMRALTPDGIYVLVGGSQSRFFQAMFLGPFISLIGRKKIGTMQVKPGNKDLIWLTGLLEAGKVVPVVNRRVSLREVPDAIRHLEEGHAKGKVVILVSK
jgi:NADPH:quinone reductase-like Zn-dependent oxidoreductase